VRPQPHHPHLTGRIAAADAHLLGRCKANRKLPLVGRLHDGSYLSVLGGVTVRVIDAEITIATRAGRASGSYRLATTLTDAHTWPATTLVTLYHQRWEIETAYLELKSSILGGRVLRARTPPASTKRSMPC
jgi:IS4 transposase